jgi:hypothetical protein
LAEEVISSHLVLFKPAAGEPSRWARLVEYQRREEDERKTRLSYMQ